MDLADRPFKEFAFLAALAAVLFVGTAGLVLELGPLASLIGAFSALPFAEFVEGVASGRLAVPWVVYYAGAVAIATAAVTSWMTEGPARPAFSVPAIAPGRRLPGFVRWYLMGAYGVVGGLVVLVVLQNLGLTPPHLF